MNKDQPAQSGSDWARHIFLGASQNDLVADIGGDPAAQPVILLHGGGQTRHSWANTTKTFAAAGYRVINLDLRGHGDSAWATDGDYSLGAFVSDLATLASSLQRPPIIVGASLGGIAALCMAASADAPPVKAIVLVDIVPLLNEAGTARIRQFMTSGASGFKTIEEAAAAVAAYKSGRARSGSTAGLRKNLRLRDGRLHWHWDPQFISGPRTVNADEVRQRIVDGARHVRCPVLLVRGGDSDIVHDEGVMHLRAILPDVAVAEIKGASHMIASDSNDAFNGAIVKFLAEIATPSSD